MNEAKKFFSENILMSIAGHLALVSTMLVSLHIIVEKSKLVSPDRVQITEIDLSNIKITREDTSLYNTELLKSEPKPEIKKTPFPEPVGDEKAIDKPSMVTDNKKDDKKQNETAPKTRTVVRVNRETASLKRTMTISVIDALRVAMTRCWVIDNKHAGISDIRAVVHLTMNKNGMIRDYWFESAARADSDPAFAYVLETIRGALAACQPFKMLPASEFDHWEKVQLTFYPTTGTVQ